MTILLHIDELVLDGYAPADRYRIATAVETELAHLLATTGVPAGLQAGLAITYLDGGSFGVAPRSGPEAIGSQVAQAVYRSLSR